MGTEKTLKELAKKIPPPTLKKYRREWRHINKLYDAMYREADEGERDAHRLVRDGQIAGYIPLHLVWNVWRDAINWRVRFMRLQFLTWLWTWNLWTPKNDNAKRKRKRNKN